MPTKLEKPIPVELTLFVKHLRYARDSAELTQREVAEIAGITKNYISRLENEQITIGIDSMAVISQALKIPLFKMLDPLLIRNFEQVPQEWDNYRKLIDNSYDIPFERRVLAENFKRIRITQGYMQKDVINQAQINKAFLISFEKASCGISLDNALKLSRFIMIPLGDLLVPIKIKTT